MKLTDPTQTLTALIRCPSVTPEEGGALTELAGMLSELGFANDRVTFSDEGTPDVENLYSRLGSEGPHLMFAGHTDVVPVGDAEAWTQGPFSADIVDGEMYGRGAVDMKGGIACFVSALARLIERKGPLKGSVSLLITGDEEGPSINGTEKLLVHAAGKGERWDAAVVGEPTNPDQLGDMIKIGRRGSLSGTLTVEGVQGHVAYPHLADNPLPGMMALASALIDPPLDAGNERFPPSNLEITSIDTGNTATNVIPARCTAKFNIRFNDQWTAESLKAELRARIEQASGGGSSRTGQEKVRYTVKFADRPSSSFLTHDAPLIEALSNAVTEATGRTPALSTTGGTSDARFIKDYCPVVEFGLVGKTMHMVDERVAVSDLEALTGIYELFLERWFDRAGAH
ncbi:succinyl-diaminopimelate desuccinylase, proteobacterial clade [Hoeflea phototrophica DFL-43]|jgi:succinyl-diaminopimelate desuccinylase|uniref:Succinyl-diaminopimelate desuccinylase n=1 Tax=Hoeflea phototrophica (strain DSM 17068 / NCIMB 14078 / DFL-43) TaxID=411684 RepID=A9CXA9_HOEPD|nr:succinyl-diaminopimelate desuccinylase [Hoeflea phototrophica]EDQ35635.1 succinyl-diaminopimelate desuccinylase, proteobacterial clade [Hoeflea phototrophica DFL-43]